MNLGAHRGHINPITLCDLRYSNEDKKGMISMEKGKNRCFRKVPRRVSRSQLEWSQKSWIGQVDSKHAADLPGQRDRPQMSRQRKQYCQLEMVWVLSKSTLIIVV